MESKEARKEKYTAAEIEVITFDDKDIITTSDQAGHNYNTPKIPM